MANEYMNKDELKATRELLGTFADQDIAIALEAASRGIEGVTNRRFYLDSGTTTRYYTPRSETVMLIDDATSVATVAPTTAGAASLILNTDYVLEPLNASADGRPYTMVTAIRGGFSTVPRSMQVSGVFGWPAVPAPVKQATGILASRLLMRAREAPFGIVFSGADVGVATRLARSDPDVMFLLDPYIEGVLIA